jgi:hypothetical protein
MGQLSAVVVPRCATTTATHNFVVNDTNEDRCPTHSQALDLFEARCDNKYRDGLRFAQNGKYEHSRCGCANASSKTISLALVCWRTYRQGHELLGQSICSTTSSHAQAFAAKV